MEVVKRPIVGKVGDEVKKRKVGVEQAWLLQGV